MYELNPKPFQAPIVDRICAALNENGRALVVMATGTGKTLTVGFALRRRLGAPSKNRRVLVLAHMNAILGHVEKEFEKLFPARSVDRLYDGQSVDSRADIVYANFGTIRNRIREGAFSARDFEAVVVDEGHHAQADAFRDVIRFFTPKDLIAMTATPDRMDGKDITKLFGEPVVSLTLARAMANGHVTKVKYKLMSGEGLAEEIEAIKKDLASGMPLTKKQVERRLFRVASDHGFLELMKELDPKAKVIVFADSIARANHLVSQVSDARTYHSGDDGATRAGLLERFREGSVRRLISVDALNEGVDVPDADVIIFLRATESLTVFLQQLGRGLRLAPGKEWVTVYDFVGTVRRLTMLHDFLQEVKRSAAEDAAEGAEGKPVSDGPDRDPTSDDERDVPVFDLGDIDSVKVDFSQELVDILGLLEGFDKDFYPTLAEASAAAQRLGIKTQKEYMGTAGREGRYKEDMKLYSAPYAFYSDWVCWAAFLGTGYYPTLAEASAAVQRLGIKTYKEYQGEKGREGRYKEDTRLPYKPSRIYPDWAGWAAFLGLDPGPGFYPTLAEASVAAQRLGIKRQAEYMGTREREGRYKEDSRLRSNPAPYYPDWVDWPTFLGTKVL